MFDKLDQVKLRYNELTSMMADPSITGDHNQLRVIAQEHSQLQEIVAAYDDFNATTTELQETRQLFQEAEDEEMREMAREEVQQLEAHIMHLEETLQTLLLPKDPLDKKNIYLEIRAGAGGDEAAIFVGDLFRMYSRYADKNRWKVELMSATESDKGGYREIIARIDGSNVYSRLKYESGTHRVQRVPATESQGRIHTSTVTVAIIPEADEVELDINKADLRIDTYRSSGAGGQHVNTTDSAVRITHVPTGVVVQCQNERSQIKNRATAMKMLTARLLDVMEQEQKDSIAQDRREQVGSGDRSERIRTYNYPQSRITDHRIGFSTSKLDGVLAGEVDEVVDPLVTHHQVEALKQLNQG